MALGTRIKASAKTPIGYVFWMAVIVLLSGFLVGALEIPVGAIFMLIVAFGLPIYLGWNLSLRKFLSVAVAVLLFAPLVTGLVVTQTAVAPSPEVSSSDNVLRNATATPFESSQAHSTFTFRVDVFPWSTNTTNTSIRVEEVYLWVTNCEEDTDTAKGACYLSPPDFFKNVSQTLTEAQQNESVVPLTFTLSDLPSGEIFYFIFLTAIATKYANSVWYYGLDENVGGWSCTVAPSYSGCSYVEGPISASWAQVYWLLAPADYLTTLVLVAVLAAIIFVYVYLKGREKLRRAKAKAAAEGTEGAPPGSELHCPHCQAVVDKGETTCWRCKKDLSAPVEANTPSGATPSSSSKPLPSSKKKAPPPQTSGEDEGTPPSSTAEAEESPSGDDETPPASSS